MVTETMWTPADEGRRYESDDRLLLREFAHRTGNDYAMALAAMRLVVAGPRDDARARLVKAAVFRLEASSAMHLLLARPVSREEDAGALVREICGRLADARPEAWRSRLAVEAGAIVVHGELARRMALVAAELVANSIRHALGARAGSLVVRLDRFGGKLRMIVADDGAGMRPGSAASGTGLGGGIVAELVARGGGSISVDTGPSGTVVEVTFPTGPEESSDDGYEF